MIEQWLYPSLRHGGVKETRSYRISSFLYVGFFGGLLPVLVLGTMNGLWLRVSKRTTLGMLLVGLILLASTFFYTWMTGSMLDTLLFSRVTAAGLGLGYRCVLKKRFRLHSVVQGEYRPLTKPAILLSIVSLPLEFLLLRTGEVYFYGDVVR